MKKKNFRDHKMYSLTPGVNLHPDLKIPMLFISKTLKIAPADLFYNPKESLAVDAIRAVNVIDEEDRQRLVEAYRRIFEAKGLMLWPSYLSKAVGLLREKSVKNELVEKFAVDELTLPFGRGLRLWGCELRLKKPDKYKNFVFWESPHLKAFFTNPEKGTIGTFKSFFSLSSLPKLYECWAKDIPVWNHPHILELLKGEQK